MKEPAEMDIPINILHWYGHFNGHKVRIRYRMIPFDLIEPKTYTHTIFDLADLSCVIFIKIWEDESNRSSCKHTYIVYDHLTQSHVSEDEKTRLLVWSRWMPDEQVFDGCFMVVEVEACIMKPHKVKHDNTEWVSWGGLEPFQLIQVEAKADYHLNGPSYWWTSIKSWFLIAFMNFTQVKIDLLFQPYPAVHFTKNIYAELFISQKHGCPSDLG